MHSVSSRPSEFVLPSKLGKTGLHENTSPFFAFLELRNSQDFRETCVSRSLTFRLETKMPWRQTPSRKKKAVVFTTVTTSAYQGQLNAGYSKVCEIFKVRGIESLKFVREFYTPVCYCGNISTHRNVMLNETNCDWLFDMSVKWPHGRALANESYHRFQIFSSQSEGLATRDYVIYEVHTEVTFKPSSFQLVNAANPRDQLEPNAKLALGNLSHFLWQF